MQGFLRLDRVFVHLSAEHIDKRGAAAAGGAALRSPGSRMRDRLEIAECLAASYGRSHSALIVVGLCILVLVIGGPLNDPIDRTLAPGGRFRPSRSEPLNCGSTGGGFDGGGGCDGGSTD
jgi:hypothetical protein